MGISWTEDLATGVAEVDAQHRELYRQVSALHEAMRERRLERIPELLDFLQRYVLEHFAAEERAMGAAGYPGLDVHRARHREFVTEFLRQRSAVDVSGATPLVVVELSDWLGRWLREHVRKVDGEMARYLRQRAG